MLFLIILGSRHFVYFGADAGCSRHAVSQSDDLLCPGLQSRLRRCSVDLARATINAECPIGVFTLKTNHRPAKIVPSVGPLCTEGRPIDEASGRIWRMTPLQRRLRWTPRETASAQRTLCIGPSSTTIATTRLRMMSACFL